LRAFLREAASAIAPRRSLTCLITTDAELTRLNREFRRKDYPADVLSFPSPDGQELGEIAISLDRALEQAARMGHGVEAELRILMLHGILHLNGMDHETDSGEMARAERAWRKKFSLPLGLIERSTK
jgi:probable rRNA maturation factor